MTRVLFAKIFVWCLRKLKISVMTIKEQGED